MTILLALLIAAAAPEEAYRNLDRAKLAGDEAQGRIATAVRALTDAGMPRTATVLLAALAFDPEQSEGVRAAAKAELAQRAAQDPSLGQLLIARESDPGKLPAALAVAVARSHLERALQIAPPEEGFAFEGLQQAPALQPAAAQPLDKELAAEMGLSAKDAQAPLGPAGQEAQALPPLAQRELDQARALSAMVPAGDPAEGEAHEVAGLAALAAGDDRLAAKEFVAVAQLPVRQGDARAAERRDKAYLQLARLAYQSGDDARATELYEKVGSGAPEWLDALFEASWAHFRKAQDEKALGNLLTLHAPFFQDRFFPESFVLKALVMYENCRYADARAALAEFAQRYQPVHDGIAEALGRLDTAQRAYELLARGPSELQSLPPAAREEVARIAQDPDVQGALAAALQLAQEIDSVDRRPEPFRNSSLVARVAPLARQARLELLESAGRKLVSRLSSERAELRELLSQSLRLSYEISGREKELAASPDSDLTVRSHRDPPQVQDDEELWPFQGEYWRDELGSYRYQLGQRCKKPRALPQTAQERRSGPAKVAGDPSQ